MPAEKTTTPKKLTRIEQLRNRATDLTAYLRERLARVTDPEDMDEIVYRLENIANELLRD